MKKIFGTLAVIMMATTVSFADPGPYDAYLSSDPCDTNGADAVATPCNTVGENSVYEAINYLLAGAGVASPFTSNTDLDAVQLNFPHSYWTNSGGIGVLSFINVSAGGYNTPGIYQQGDPGSALFMSSGATGNVYLGDGSLANPYPSMLNPFGASNFGVVIDHSGQNPDYLYSDPTLNPDGLDHMLAFDLRSFLNGKTLYMDFGGGNIQQVVVDDAYFLAFEDRPLELSDHDYNDLGFLFARVTPVPEPMTMTLFGTGLVGMALRRRKA